MSKLVERKPEPSLSVNGMSVTVDPSGKYKGIKPGKIWQSLGLIPYFVNSVAMTPDVDTTEAAAQILLDAYGFGFSVDHNMVDHGSQIDKDGVYSYPEDPDLYPLVQFEVQNGIKIYVYEYALVGVDDGETQWMARFD